MRIRLALFALALLVVAGLWAPQTRAQETRVQDEAQSKELNTEAYVQLLRTDLSRKKGQIVKETMELDDAQAKIFWPIYHQYQAEQDVLTTEKLAIVAEYSHNFSTMTDAKADELAQRTMQLDEKRMALREKYYGILKKALSPTVAIRFFQVEHQLQLIVDLQIAANLPIVEQSDTR